MDISSIEGDAPSVARIWCGSKTQSNGVPCIWRAKHHPRSHTDVIRILPRADTSICHRDIQYEVDFHRCGRMNGSKTRSAVTQDEMALQPTRNKPLRRVRFLYSTSVLAIPSSDFWKDVTARDIVPATSVWPRRSIKKACQSLILSSLLGSVNTQHLFQDGGRHTATRGVCGHA